MFQEIGEGVREVSGSWGVLRLDIVFLGVGDGEGVTFTRALVVHEFKGLLFQLINPTLPLFLLPNLPLNYLNLLLINLLHSFSRLHILQILFLIHLFLISTFLLIILLTVFVIRLCFRLLKSFGSSYKFPLFLKLIFFGYLDLIYLYLSFKVIYLLLDKLVVIDVSLGIPGYV